MNIEELLYGIGSMQIASERLIKTARTVKGMKCVRITGPSDVDSGLKPAPAPEVMANPALTADLAEWLVEVPGHGTGINAPGRNELGYEFIWVARTVALARRVSEMYDDTLHPIFPELGTSSELLRTIRQWRELDTRISPG